ncbi:MAG: SPOR domain-containing protein, partial [Mariprofundaceae bacterium]|nr:SPOR domain-containing protein [Mariprofundaceae bacterium]
PQLETRISIQEISSSAATSPAATPGPDIAAAADGQMFIINIASFASEAEATAAQRKLSETDIRTGIVKVSVQARTWFRLYSRDHVRKADAQIKLAELKVRSGYPGAWLEPVH